jgi:membrane protein required for beta-lactamase induction
MVVTNSSIKAKKLGPVRNDVARVIDAIRKNQESCAEKHAKKMGLHSLSVKEKDELKYLAYGAS